MLGLDAIDGRYLKLIAESFGGGPVGIETISAALSEPRDAIEEIVEPYLFQCGLLQRTSRGRLVTSRVSATSACLRLRAIPRSSGYSVPTRNLTRSMQVISNRAALKAWRKIVTLVALAHRLGADDLEIFASVDLFLA